MTLVPRLFMTRILAILVSLVFLVWVTVFVQRRHGGLVLILLSGLMLIVGGGFGPPILGIIVGIAAIGINAPLMWWRTRLSEGPRRFLAKVWPWSYVAGIIAWLLVLPGTILLDYFFGVSDLDFIVPTLALTVLSAFELLLVTVVAAFAYDVQRQIGLHKTHSISE